MEMKKFVEVFPCVFEMYIVWKKREDLKREFFYVQKHPSELYSVVLFEQVMCLCLGPST